MPTTHVTDADIEQFGRRLLPGDRLVAFADHLADCSDCRRRVAGQSDAATAAASLDEGLGVGADDHVAEPEIHAFVDGGLDAERRAEISTHLARCPACRAEIRDLQAFAAQLGRRRDFRAPWMYGALSAAAVVVVGVALAFWSRAPVSPQMAANKLAAGDAGPDRSDTLAGVGTLEPADEKRVRNALETGRLSLPSTRLADLRGQHGTLMGPADPPAFRLVAPMATGVLSDRPTLQWTPLPGATRYIVTLQDESNGASTSSPPLANTEWTPDRTLDRGHTYAWQVAGSAGGTETVAPAPPDPPARFVVAQPDDAARLARLPSSHLVRGVLYANAGLLDDAERELKMVAADTGGSDRVAAFVEQLHRAREPR